MPMWARPEMGMGAVFVIFNLPPDAVSPGSIRSESFGSRQPAASFLAKNDDMLPGQVALGLQPFQGVKGGLPAHLGFGHGVQGLDRHVRVVCSVLDEHEPPAWFERTRDGGEHLVRILELV